MQIQLSTAKSEYTIDEAARLLGISSQELRSLLIRHVLDETEAIQHLRVWAFPGVLTIFLVIFSCGGSSPRNATPMPSGPWFSTFIVRTTPIGPSLPERIHSTTRR